MNKKVIITNGEYKGYVALVNEINNKKLKLDITFENFILPKNDKNIKIISENKVLLPLKMFNNIDLHIKANENDLIKTLGIKNSLVNKINEYSWVIGKNLSEEEKKDIESFGFEILKQSDSFTFINIKGLVCDYKLNSDDTIEISGFNANIKINSSVFEKSQNKDSKLFFHPFFFNKSDIVSNESINNIIPLWKAFNVTKNKDNQINIVDFINKYIDKEILISDKISEYYTIINGSLAGKTGKLCHHMEGYDKEYIPLELEGSIVIGINTLISNPFWKIKINKINPFVSLRLEAENKMVRVYSDEYKSVKDVQELEKTLMNLGLGLDSEEFLDSIDENLKENLLTAEEEVENFEIQAEEIINEKETNYEDVALDPEDKMEDNDSILEETEEEDILEENEDTLYLEESNYKVSFKEKDQFTENKDFSDVDKELYNSIITAINNFKADIKNPNILFDIVKKEIKKRKKTKFDKTNFIYAVVMFYSSKDIPKKGKIRMDKKLIEEYTSYLKLQSNPRVNSESNSLSVIAQELIPIKNKDISRSYYFNKEFKKEFISSFKFYDFKIDSNNKTSRIEPQLFTDPLDDSSNYEFENEYLKELKEKGIFDSSILYQIELLMKRGHSTEIIKKALQNNGITHNDYERFFKDFLENRDIIEETAIETTPIVLTLLNYIKENLSIENDVTVPVHLILTRFIRDSNIDLSNQSFSNIINNLKLTTGLKEVVVNKGVIYNAKIKDYFEGTSEYTKKYIEEKKEEIKNISDTDRFLFNDEELEFFHLYTSNEIEVVVDKKIELFDVYKRFFKYYKIQVLKKRIEILSQNQENSDLLVEFTNALNYVNDPIHSKDNFNRDIIPLFGSYDRFRKILSYKGFDVNIKDQKLNNFKFKVEEFNPDKFYTDKLQVKDKIIEKVNKLHTEFLKELLEYFNIERVVFKDVEQMKKTFGPFIPTIDDFYSIAFLVRISDKKSLQNIMSYSTEQIINVLTEEFLGASMEPLQLQSFIADVIKNGKEKIKDRNKNSLINYINKEKNERIGMLKPELFDRIYTFISNTTFVYKKQEDNLAPVKREYYVQPVMKNFPKEYKGLNNIKNNYIDKILNAMKTLEEEGVIVIIHDTDEFPDIQLKDSKLAEINKRADKRVNEYIKEKKKGISDYIKLNENFKNSSRINLRQLSKLFNVNPYLSSNILDELEQKFINIYLQKEEQEYSFDFVISLYDKFKNYTWFDNKNREQMLSNKYKDHINLINFINSMSRYFFIEIMDIKIKVSTESSENKFLYCYDIGKNLQEFSFENYLKSVVANYYGVLYENSKSLLVDLYFKEQKDFDSWVNSLNEDLKREGKPVWSSDSIIMNNYYKIFNLFQKICKKIKTEDVLSILNPQEKIKTLIKYKISFDLEQALKPLFKQHLNSNKIKNILLYIKNNKNNIIIPDYKKNSLGQQDGLVVREIITTAPSKKELIQLKVFIIEYVINVHEKFMEFFENIVFLIETDEKKIEELWPSYYIAQDIMKKLSLFEYNKEKDNYTMNTILFLLSLPPFTLDQIELLKVVPIKRKEMEKSITVEPKVNKKEIEDDGSLADWILENAEPSNKRKKQDKDINELSLRLRSSTF